MSKDTVIELRKSEQGRDLLNTILREGAQWLVAEAMQVKFEEFLERFGAQRANDARAAVVRNGFQPERELLTGTGPVAVRIPKARSRTDAPAVFHSHLVPPYVRRANPWSWRCAKLGKERWVYLWADGIHLGVRDEDERPCALVAIGVNGRGQKHFLVIEDGVRESEQSWREVLLDLKRRGLAITTRLAVGDGALGFWAALEEIYPETRQRRCWKHKTVNVLNSEVAPFV